MKKYNSALVPNSKTLRKNMTKEERRIWYDFLKNSPVTINRQKVIGEYIVDFYCASVKTVIEIDGLQHYEEKGKTNDLVRDKKLTEDGYKILRYSNFMDVCFDILKHLAFQRNKLIFIDGRLLPSP